MAPHFSPLLMLPAVSRHRSHTPHLDMIPVESHDRSEEEEGEVEVVFEQVSERVAAVLLLAVLQCEAHTAHDAEAAASVEQDVLQVEGARHQGFLEEESFWAHYLTGLLHPESCTSAAHLHFQQCAACIIHIIHI